MAADWGKRQHQINQFLMKEAHRGLSDQEKLSIEREMEKFQAVEKELQQFITKGPK